MTHASKLIQGLRSVALMVPDLQKAEELFISNVIKGIQPITKYRKKEFGNTLATKFVALLNAQIRLT
jgi:branched-chain amino acid aminotransferase